MQKLILSVCFFLVLSAAASAQSFELGAKVGANFGKIDGQSFKDGYNFGYVLGGYVNLGINKTLAIQPELLFSQTNTTFKDSSSVIITTFKSTFYFFADLLIFIHQNAELRTNLESK